MKEGRFVIKELMYRSLGTKQEQFRFHSPENWALDRENGPFLTLRKYFPRGRYYGGKIVTKAKSVKSSRSDPLTVE